MDEVWIINLMNELKLMFINVEVSCMIALIIKSLMEMSLFQWSQAFKNLEWKPMIDAWFGKLKVSIYINNYYFNV